MRNVPAHIVPARSRRCKTSQTYDSLYEQQVQELAKGVLADFVQGIRTSVGTTPAGASTPSAEELGSFFFHQQTLYPPQLFQYPDGHTVFASPWILELEFAMNGKDWLAKYESFLTKAGVSV